MIRCTFLQKIDSILFTKKDPFLPLALPPTFTRPSRRPSVNRHAVLLRWSRNMVMALGALQSWSHNLDPWKSNWNIYEFPPFFIHLGLFLSSSQKRKPSIKSSKWWQVVFERCFCWIFLDLQLSEWWKLWWFFWDHLDSVSKILTFLFLY